LIDLAISRHVWVSNAFLFPRTYLNLVVRYQQQFDVLLMLFFMHALEGLGEVVAIDNVIYCGLCI